LSSTKPLPTWVLVTLTLILQSAGMAVLIQWARAHLSRGIHQFGTLRSAALVIRLTSLTVGLHMLTILPWACFYRWNCVATWESAISVSTASFRCLGPCSASNLANAVPDRKYRRRIDVWPLCKVSICDCHPFD
jgi:hypothetical protein